MDDAISHRHRVIAPSSSPYRIIAIASHQHERYRTIVIVIELSRRCHRIYCCVISPSTQTLMVLLLTTWPSLNFMGIHFSWSGEHVTAWLIRCTGTQMTKMYHDSVGNKDSQETFPREHNPISCIRNLISHSILLFKIIFINTNRYDNWFSRF